MRGCLLLVTDLWYMDGGHNAHTKAEQAPCHLSKLHKDSYCQEEQWVDRYCSEV